jgi:ribose 5-phosphate isomerase B
MKIVIGSDHIGYELKLHIKEYLVAKGHEVSDIGTDGTARTDYPVFAEKAAEAVAAGEYENGILICGSGVGMSIAANKVRGVRAVVCSESYSAKLAKEHNNANIVAFGSRVIGIAIAETIVDAFIGSHFENGRHQKRIEMIDKLEEK